MRATILATAVLVWVAGCGGGGEAPITEPTQVLEPPGPPASQPEDGSAAPAQPDSRREAPLQPARPAWPPKRGRADHDSASAWPASPPASPRVDLAPDATSGQDATAAPVPTTQPAPESEPSPSIQPNGPAKVLSASLLQINDQFLTIDDVLRGAAMPLSELPANITERTFRQQAQKIIEDEARRQTRRLLVYPEANARLAERLQQWLDNEMDQVLRDMIAGADGSRRKLETRLRLRHTSLEEVLENHRQQLIVQEYLRWRFMPGLSITRGMMVEYYRLHPEEFTTPAKVQMQIIAIPFDSTPGDVRSSTSPEHIQAARRQARARIEQANAALQGGEDFADVARRFSKDAKGKDGGLWPMMPAGSFRTEAVEKAAFAMSQGQTSDIIETDEGLYIVRVCKVQPGQAAAFEQAQASIEKTLREQQLFRRYDEYYRQLLSKAAVIESGNFIPAAVDRAVELYWRQRPSDL